MEQRPGAAKIPIEAAVRPLGKLLTTLIASLKITRKIRSQIISLPGSLFG